MDERTERDLGTPKPLSVLAHDDFREVVVSGAIVPFAWITRDKEQTLLIAPELESEARVRWPSAQFITPRSR